jgi:hypothetical protein
MYAAGQMTGYNWAAGQFGYAAADLTCAYNSMQFSWPGQKPKIRRAARALVYLPEPETVLVYDRIVSTSAEYQKKWLLHTVNKPEAPEVRVLKGEADNGILEALGKNLAVTNGKGVMNVQALLPDKSRWLVLGGPDYRFYIETDGDQANGFDGQSPGRGSGRGGYFDAGNWRVELEPTVPADSDDFLVAMALGTVDERPKHKATIVGRGEGFVACQIGGTMVLFVDAADGASSVDAKATPAAPVARVVACALTPPRPVPVDCFETVQPPRASAQRELEAPLPPARSAALTVGITADGAVDIRIAG